MSQTADCPPQGILELACEVVHRLERSLPSTKTEGAGDVNPASNTTHSLCHSNIDVSLLARGGFNDVWLVRPPKIAPSALPTAFILRISNDDAFKPHQILSEVGWLRHVRKHCPEIPVPTVYDFHAGEDSQPAFIAMEYVDAVPLSKAWATFTDDNKVSVARQIARIIVSLGEHRFAAIGGMTPSGSLGPTVEASKLFNGRGNYHNAACYDIGPYDSIEQYILAYYDKEIYYYSHMDPALLDEDLFIDVTPAEFLQELRIAREAARADLATTPRKQPFVLCHEDLQGRNILMRGTEIVSIIDWEFAGSLPLGELIDSGVEVIECEDEASDEECFQWTGKIRTLVEEVAMDRGWDPKDIEILMRGDDRLLQGARVEMCPKC